MAKTVIALEKNTWCVARQPVPVKPGQAVVFENDAEAGYFITALDADGQRRAVTENEWAQIVAEHNAANVAADQGDGATIGADGYETAATDTVADPTPAKRSKKVGK